MKRILFIFACAATLSLSAQQSLVKEAEKDMKNGKSYTEVYEKIAPAMTNPETQSDAKTYYIPGVAGFNQYDKLLGKRQIGQNMFNDGDEIIMSMALLGGYENFMKALPLDTVIDAKGKVKTEYSKKIKNILSGHYNDFPQAGVDFYNAKDMKNAYKAWDIFVEMSENPEKYDIKPETVQPDSVIANFLLNAGVAAWQLDNAKLAAEKFKAATEKGYNQENAWQYGLSTALAANDFDLLYYFATKGNELFGDKDSGYINNLINYYLTNEKYDDAIKYLDSAIAQNPGNGQYYALEGIIYDNKNENEKAIELYRKSIDIDPDNGLGNFYLGRRLAIDAGNLQDASDATGAQYMEYLHNELFPKFKEAIKYLEAGYKYEPSKRKDALQILEQLYYVTDDEAGQKSVKERSEELKRASLDD